MYRTVASRKQHQRYLEKEENSMMIKKGRNHFVRPLNRNASNRQASRSTWGDYDNLTFGSSLKKTTAEVKDRSLEVNSEGLMLSPRKSSQTVQLEQSMSSHLLNESVRQLGPNYDGGIEACQKLAILRWSTLEAFDELGIDPKRVLVDVGCKTLFEKRWKDAFVLDPCDDNDNPIGRKFQLRVKDLVSYCSEDFKKMSRNTVLCFFFLSEEFRDEKVFLFIFYVP